MSMRERGTVKMYNSEKGWGFLRLEGVRDDAFFHISKWKQRLVVDPAVGDRVIFNLVEQAMAAFAPLR